MLVDQIGMFAKKLLSVSILCIMSYTCIADELVHHHVHNFHVNYYAPDRADYAEPHKHALAMGYSMITRGKPDDKKYASLGIIKLHSAVASPLRIDTKNHKVWYHHFYSGKNGASLIRKGYKVSRWLDIENKDLENILLYACQKKHIDIDKLRVIINDADKLDEYFWERWNDDGQINLIVNWQNRAVVQALFVKTLISLDTGGEQAIFFDGLGIGTDRQCVNAGDVATKYTSWNAGKLAFLKSLQGELSGSTSSFKMKVPIFANIWNPYKKDVSKTVLKWYKNNDLRLDHYYLESGEDIHANGLDPETGKPAYVTEDGFLPASVVSLDTIYGFFGHRAGGRKLQYDHDAYELNHIDVSIAAATQGSWFGWYGEDSIDQVFRQNNHSEKVYDNTMQLLRALPGWENLNGIPLENRHYDPVLKVYDSPNSHISKGLVYSRHFKKNEIFVVFSAMNESVNLHDNDKVDSVWLANSLFEIDKALSVARCFNISPNSVALKCSEYLDRGIRIKLQ